MLTQLSLMTTSKVSLTALHQLEGVLYALNLELNANVNNKTKRTMHGRLCCSSITQGSTASMLTLYETKN